MRWLKESDAFVAEVTKTGFGVGFEAGYMLASGKKVFLLYDESLQETVSRMARGCTLKNCVRIPYNSMSDINAFVEKNF
jgi:nucleoside 2-deoxyribosyltransferase